MLNPEYEPPDKEEIREEIEKRRTVTAKLNYLRRLLVTHVQDAELPPETRYGFDVSEKKITVGENASLEVAGEGVEEADREIIDDMQRWLKLEIEYWEEKLPETCVTQKELEEGLEQEEIEAAIRGQGEGELVPWHGTQEVFTNWLSLSYDEWIGKYFDPWKKSTIWESF